MTEKAKTGTGTITAKEYEILRRTVEEQFKIEIDAMTGPKPKLSKKTATDIVAGHSDGMRNLMLALRAKGVLVVTD
jgi:hypothetical protein